MEVIAHQHSGMHGCDNAEDTLPCLILVVDISGENYQGALVN
jgi:hypothetical protein